MAVAATTIHRADHQSRKPAPARLRSVRGGAPTVLGVSDPFQHDPAFVALVRPVIEGVNRYFGTEVRGWSHVPKGGPFLIVGNHSGGAETHDLWFVLGNWIQRRGATTPLYALGYDLLFNFPIVGPLLPKLGVVPTNRANAVRAFAMSAPVLVFPGGDHEVFRPWSQRNRIDFGGHMGFIELAIRSRVPVVPMTIHGAHESTLTLTRGRRLARWLGIDRLHVQVFPLIWSIPFGVAPAFVPSVQLPSKVTVEFGRPLDWSRFGVRQAHDPRVSRECYDEITESMQATLDALARERPFPVLSRLNELRGRASGPGAARSVPRSSRGSRQLKKERHDHRWTLAS